MKEKPALLILAHGSGSNPESSKTCYMHAEAIRQGGNFQEVHCAFLSEKPFIKGALEKMKAEKIIVHPFFLAEGEHSQIDIPELLGIGKGEDAYGVTHQIKGKQIRLTAALGTSPRITTLIAEMALGELLDSQEK